MNKKWLFGILLFLVFGFVMITFANPNGDGENKTNGKENNTEIEESVNEEVVEPVIEEVDENNNEDENIVEEVTNVQNNQIVEQTTTQQPTTVDLTTQKQQAKTEVKDYATKLEIKNTDSIDSILDEVNGNIDNATTEDDINNLVEEAKKELDTIKTEEELEKAKQKAIDEIKEYKKEYEYNESNQKAYDKLLEQIVSNINNSQTIDSVTSNLEDGKEDIDALITQDLTEYKNTKKEELENYAKETKWNETNQIVVDSILDDAKKLIDEANTKEAIDKIVEETKTKLDELKQQQELEEYKEIKKEEINNYNENELYSEENQKEIDSIKEIAKELIDLADSKEQIDQIINNTKEQIDNIQKLEETKFTVTFTGFDGKTIKEEKVLYGDSATAPTMNNVTKRSIEYTFKNWDKDFSDVKSDITVKANYVIDKIYANVYSLKEGVEQPENGKSAGNNNYIKIGKVELKQTDEILKTLNNNKNSIISQDESTIINAVNGSLPVLDKLNYKYNYYVLKFEKADGFHIDASQVIDEEALTKNTVTITYQLDSSLTDCVMENNQTTITNTVTTGRNEITSLPKVYKNGVEQAVVWKDNNRIISNITVGKVSLNNNPTVYTTSTTLTASLDTTGPELTLNGDIVKNVELSLTDEYVEEYFTATDNFDGDLTNKVQITITYNGVSTNAVDYSTAGTYVITYSVTDSNGNLTVKTRTINVNDPITELKAEVYVLNSGVSRDTSASFNKENYTKIGEVDLKVDKLRKYINNGDKLISDNGSNISSFIINGNKSLPNLNDKYYYYEYYAIKYVGNEFYIECEKMFNSELYKADKLKELNKLLTNNYREYKNTKTTDSYNNLINTVNEYKNKKLNTIEEIENAINNINNSINNLVDIKLLSLSLSSNNDIYNKNDRMKNIVVTAIYNDSTRNKVLNKNEYTKAGEFDSKTTGSKNITYSYEDKNVVYNYTVNYSDHELNNMINRVDISLEQKTEYDKHQINKIYMLQFKNLNSLGISKIEINKDNKIINTIDLTNLNNGTLILSEEDYYLLKNNNTLLNNSIIKVTYYINNQQVTVNYYEFGNNLIKM